ncbi:hypothetical protein FB45DRAFT_926828 [Roridomyces roridus]|uniref:F-box domain-containing protein n=1 Tax=Roridomyces roridus TaxID=1738132 RepID=A0AAD7BL18_9AGAR|nr:hypothetical protein FB45DRAFT_926828 [Roridomyces roridus]
MASPVCRVPSEIISEIFSWTVPSPSEMRRLRGSKVEQSPWILGHICSCWRAIALSTSSLWSLVHMSSSRAADPLSMIQTQLERATVTLKIHFQFDRDWRDHELSAIQLFDLLLEHSTRWVELNIQFTDAMLTRLTTLPRGRFPLLKRLLIEQNAFEYQLNAVRTIQCFEHAPSLVDVGVINSRPRDILVPLPAHQLTSYQVQESWATHRPLLESAPNLIEARILLAGSPDWSDHRGVIDMLNLQRLYVSHVEFLSYLWAPALAEVASCVDSEEPLYISFNALFRRSSCAPRRLCLRGLPDPRATARILKEYPSITNLILIFSATGDANTLSRFANSHLTILGSPTNAPQLCEIYIASEKAFGINHSLFLSMLEARRNTLNHTALVMQCGPEPGPVAQSRLDALRVEGLDIWVNSGSRGALEQIQRWKYAPSWVS